MIYVSVKKTSTFAFFQVSRVCAAYMLYSYLHCGNMCAVKCAMFTCYFITQITSRLLALNILCAKNRAQRDIIPSLS